LTNGRGVDVSLLTVGKKKTGRKPGANKKKARIIPVEKLAHQGNTRWPQGNTSNLEAMFAACPKKGKLPKQEKGKKWQKITGFRTTSSKLEGRKRGRERFQIAERGEKRTEGGEEKKERGR